MWLVARSPVRTPSFQHDCSRRNRRRPARRRPLTRLWLEILEDRALLSSVSIVTDNSDNPTDTGSLRYAINNATSGSTIEFASSVISPITLTNGVLTIGTNLNIQGPGANNLTISGNNSSGIFSVASGTTATIAGLTLTKGMTADGGAIQSAGTLTLNSCAVTQSTATLGGGIDNTGAMAANDCTISGNSAASGGGGFYNDAALTIINCTIAENSAAQGGGVDNVSPAILSVADCTISGNSATSAGGDVSNAPMASTVLANTIIAENTPPSSNPSSGPDVDGAVTSRGYNLIGNPSGGSGFVATDLKGVNPLLGPLQNNGGPTQTMALLPGSPAVEAGSNYLVPSGVDTDQRGNPREVNGVDIGAFERQIYLVYSTADGGGGSLRAALANADQDEDSVIAFTASGVIGLASPLPAISRDLQILGPSVQNLTVSGSGANPVFDVNAGVTATIAGLTIADGSGTDGGGIVNDGTLTVDNCALSGNSASSGGGIYNQGVLTVTSSTLSRNSASTGGGGIDNVAALTLINSTLFGNSAATGGGILSSAGMLKVTNSTISGNSAASAGGGIDAISAPTVANTIIAGNTAPTGPDVGGTVTSLGYNLIGDSSGGSGFAAADLLNVSPVLGPLQNSGGLTETMPLLPSSPAIAAGSVALAVDASGNPLTTDQRGSARVVNGKVDIGAFQSHGFTITVTSGNNQQAAVGTLFAELTVTVSSPVGDPVSGGVVKFTTPASGASATFLSGGDTATVISSGNGLGQAFIFVTANATVGSYTVSASIGTGGGASIDLTNTSGMATQLVIHTQPSATAIAGQAFAIQPVIYVEDQAGNLETGDSSTQVTVSLSNSTTALETVKVIGGVATFANLSYAGSGVITLDFTSGTLTMATSSAITITPVAPSKLLLQLPSTASFGTGTPYTIIVLAEDAFGNRATGYQGTVQFTSTAAATLPGKYAFAASDNGVHTFTNGVIFDRAGTATITVHDTANPSIAGSITITVTAAAAGKFSLDIPNTGSIFTDTLYPIIVVAQDAFGNRAGGYRGTVRFTSTARATLPRKYQFTAADNGVHTFTKGVIFGKAGTVTITVRNTATPAIKGSVTVTVRPNTVAAARVAATKARSRRPARGAPAARAELQAHASVELQPGNSSQARQTVMASAGAILLHQASVIARHVPDVARADVVREHILAELSGGLRAYLAAERLASARLE